MKKRLIALLSVLVLALGLTVTAWAEETVTYMDWDDTQNALVERTLSQAYTLVTPSTIPTATPWGVNEATTWYVISGNATIDGDLGMTGKLHLILMDGSSLTVNGTLNVSGTGAGLTIYGQRGGTGSLVATGADTGGEGFGIKAHNLTINGGNVTGKGGNGYTSSYGIYSAIGLTINGGSVTGTGGSAVTATDSNSTSASYGVYSEYGDITLANNASLTATGGNATTSYGIYLAGTYGSGHATMTSGTLVAKATDTGSNTAKAIKVASFTLPDPYWWRTAETGDFTKSADAAYVYSNEGGKAYNEITTLDPAPPAAPDASTHSHTRRQPTTTTETAPDTTTTTTDTVTSAKTFDAGVAVYGVMAVTSLLGMGYVGKKRV